MGDVYTAVVSKKIDVNVIGAGNNFDVDIPGSPGWTPVAVMCYLTGSPVVDTNYGFGALAVGYATSSEQVYSSFYISDDGSTHAVRSMGSDAIAKYSAIASLAMDIDAITAASTGPATDKWTFNVGSGVGGTVVRYATFIFFGGSGVTADIGIFALNTSSGGHSVSHGLGVEPDIVFQTNIGFPNTVENSSHTILSVGCSWNDTTPVDKSVILASEDNVASSNTAMYTGTTASSGQVLWGPTTSWLGDISAYSTTDFTLNTSANPGSDYVAWMALRIDGASVELIDLTTPTSAGSDWNPFTSFEPQLSLAVIGGQTSVDTAAAADTSISLCAFDGTRKTSYWFGEEHNVSEADPRYRYTESAFYLHRDPTDGTAENLFGTPTHDGSGFTIPTAQLTTVSTTSAYRGWGLFIGTTAGGPAPQTAAESLAFTDAASATAVFSRTLAESLVLADAGTQTAVFARTLAEALSLTDLATGAKDNEKSGISAEGIAFTDAASVVATFSRTIADSLALIDAASATGGEEIEVATKGGRSMTLRQMRNLERQQLLAMIREDDEVLIPLIAAILRGNNKLN